MKLAMALAAAAVLGVASESRAGESGLLGDSVTAHVTEIAAHDDFSPTTAVVGPGVEFVAATFNANVLFTLDVGAFGFTLTYQSTLAGDFNEGLTSIDITDLDFVGEQITDVGVINSTWPDGAFDGLSFQADSITIDLTEADTVIPGNTTWIATFAIAAPEPASAASSATALAALGVLPLLRRR